MPIMYEDMYEFDTPCQQCNKPKHFIFIPSSASRYVDIYRTLLDRLMGLDRTLVHQDDQMHDRVHFLGNDIAWELLETEHSILHGLDRFQQLPPTYKKCAWRPEKCEECEESLWGKPGKKIKRSPPSLTLRRFREDYSESLYAESVKRNNRLEKELVRLEDSHAELRALNMNLNEEIADLRKLKPKSKTQTEKPSKEISGERKQKAKNSEASEPVEQSTKEISGEKKQKARKSEASEPVDKLPKGKTGERKQKAKNSEASEQGDKSTKERDALKNEMKSLEGKYASLENELEKARSGKKDAEKKLAEVEKAVEKKVAEVEETVEKRVAEVEKTAEKKVADVEKTAEKKAAGVERDKKDKAKEFEDLIGKKDKAKQESEVLREKLQKFTDLEEATTTHYAKLEKIHRAQGKPSFDRNSELGSTRDASILILDECAKMTKAVQQERAKFRIYEAEVKHSNKEREKLLKQQLECLDNSMAKAMSCWGSLDNCKKQVENMFFKTAPGDLLSVEDGEAERLDPRSSACEAGKSRRKVSWNDTQEDLPTKDRSWFGIGKYV